MKSRFTIYDPIYNFYKRNERGPFKDLYNYKNTLLSRYMRRLQKLGYKHNVSATYMTGGDNDYLVIDHEKKEYCFWENGFYPFCMPPKTFPQKHDLKYWACHRH